MKGTVLLLAAVVLASSGCATSYKRDAAGNEVVWIQRIDRGTSQGKQSAAGGAFGMVAGAVGATLTERVLSDMAGRAIGGAMNSQPERGKIMITIFPDKPGKGADWELALAGEQPFRIAHLQ